MYNEYFFKPAFYLPYVALAARYKQDSGDNDGDFEDFIEDTLQKWNPGCKVYKYWDGVDFTYLMEYDGTLLISNLGTEGYEGWKSDLSPGVETKAFKKGYHHLGFWNGGKSVYLKFYDLISKYRRVVIIGQSRGGPRSIAEAEMIWDDLKIKSTVITYCGPPLHTKRGARAYNAKKIPTTRVINARDLVDDLGFGILYHVGKLVKLPFVRNKLNSIPVIGWMFGGHAYSSLYDGLIAYCRKREMAEEAIYLMNKKSIATI